MAPSQRLDEIKITDIDFDTVKSCTEKNVIKRYLKLLEEDGSYFHELMKACKEKLKELSPKDYELMYPRATTSKEIDEATRDLLNWQDAVTETDNALRKAKKGDEQAIWQVDDESGVQHQSRHPIRGQEAAVIKRPNIKIQDKADKEKDKPVDEDAVLIRDKAKMKDYYAAWDKMDVDAMEEEVDKEEKVAEEAKKAHFEEIRDEQSRAKDCGNMKDTQLPDNVPEAHKKHMADSEKEKGNEAYHCKDYEEAEVYYGRSIHYDPGDCSAWTNRALTRLKIANHSGALQDCEHALALNPKYMKALHRRGKALYELQRYEEAVRSFQLALAESPGNTQINGDLMVARRKLRSAEPAEERCTARVNDKPSCVIEEVLEEEESAKPVKKAAKPAAGYTRVTIEEDSDSEDETSASAPTVGAPRSFGAEAAAGAAASAAVPSTSGAGAGKFHKVQIVEESDSEEEASKATSKPAVARAKAAAAKPVPPQNFHKVQIVETSDSDGDLPKPASATPPAAKSSFNPPPRETVAERKAEEPTASCGDDDFLDGMD